MGGCSPEPEPAPESRPASSDDILAIPATSITDVSVTDHTITKRLVFGQSFAASSTPYGAVQQQDEDDATVRDDQHDDRDDREEVAGEVEGVAVATLGARIEASKRRADARCAPRRSAFGRHIRVNHSAPARWPKHTSARTHALLSCGTETSRLSGGSILTTYARRVCPVTSDGSSSLIACTEPGAHPRGRPMLHMTRSSFAKRRSGGGCRMYSHIARTRLLM